MSVGPQPTLDNTLGAIFLGARTAHVRPASSLLTAGNREYSGRNVSDHYLYRGRRSLTLPSRSLFGITSVQTYLYCFNNKDIQALRVMVPDILCAFRVADLCVGLGIVDLLDMVRTRCLSVEEWSVTPCVRILAALHLAFVTYFTYEDLVINFGNLAGSARSHQWCA